MANKDQIISIIDTYSSDVQRKAQLKALEGGKTYSYLLQEFYPPLRRNEMTVGYTVRAFELEEALVIYRTKPAQLSIEEFFRVANTFNKGSEEFLEVFLTAHKYFPNDAVANLNAAAAYLNSDMPSASQDALKQVEAMLQKAPKDAVETLNNKAIALFYKGDVAGAKALFTAAMKRGSKSAAFNLEELEKREASL